MKKKECSQLHGMVDVSGKDVTRRKAVASAVIKFQPAGFKILLEKGSPKGDVFECAKIAGIMAAKSTSDLIPMCHPLELGKVSVTFQIDKKKYHVEVQAEVVCLGRTGVEMEALTAAAVTALTIYDMMKWTDKGMVISDIKLLHKSGGTTGDYNR